MSDEQLAFIREIVAHPDDDVPRLIYADWLEERGDPQGEFIRVQCEIAANPQPFRRELLRQRQAALLSTHREGWLQPLGGELIRAVFRRGFVEHVQVSPKSLFANRIRWFQYAPLLTLEVKLEGRDVARLAKCSELQFVRSLRIGESDLGDIRCIRLLSSPHLTRVEELWLTTTTIGPPALRWLVESPLAMRLRVLLLSGNPLGNEGGEILARAHPLPALESLYLSSCGIDPSFVRTMQRRHPLLRSVSHP